MKIKINIKHLCAFILLFTIEVIIAIFIDDNFIRDYVGDVLVVVLIYCFVNSFIGNEIKLLWFYIFVFAALVEIGQYFNLVDLLGLGGNSLARIVLGTVFDIRDIICYFIGCIGIWIFEIVVRKRIKL